MRVDGETGIIPLRAMTAGEILDAAVALLRRHAAPLLGLSLALSALEQFLLGKLRTFAELSPLIYYWRINSEDIDWVPVVAAGLAAEAFIIAILGACAGAAAGPALLGRRLRARDMLRRARPLPALLLAVTLAALTFGAAVAGFLGVIFVYGLAGLATAVLTVDRTANPFTAMGRAVGRATRSGMRGVFLRLLGYLVWLAIRLALGSGWILAANMITPITGGSWWVGLAVPVAWALANAVAYAALACLDAVLLLEIRIRTEGLDISVNRARSLGADPAAALVVR
ncbi:hypothetical protein Aph02nite_47950 [Actinoplanes philippinensis]|uniref:Membrane domain of glycerophosphoryl diester phosphodiesterase n=1 Tax=Actinoplanes philippinensis TaxID=35752 RepID=A0A1I2HXY1_9ACTN|nr:hypothetical protein [Actinoplanes philippinensis]GIE78845.1 hypothetical protein Aph02nite_47950 [Actinoplanes philippinensis]SFF34995.1 hypothetical protein SAMN05421541_10991 [Actinoplanes philippinensis]